VLDRQKGNVVFECDACDGVLETETGDFDAAFNRFRREDWVARKIGDVWCHYCKSCKDKVS
jgi:hypothetical protein